MDFNFLRNRLQTIFGQGQDPTFESPFQIQPPEVATPPIMPGGGYDAGARMRELFQPETQNIDRFNELAGQYPQYQEPGKLKKIGAVALATLGDIGRPGAGKAGFDEMMGYAPHARKVADWKNKIDPLGDAASYERQTNNQNRQFATSTVSAEQRQQKDEATAANAAERTRIAKMRADVYDWKAKNPMAKIIAPKGGNIKAINPITGAVIMDFGPAGTLTDEERIDLENTNRTNLQNDAQAARQALQDDAQAGAVDLEGVRQGNRLEVRRTPTAAQSGSSESSTQKRVGEFLRARQIANTRQDLAQFLEIGEPGSNDFRIVPPATKQWWGGMSHGPTPEQYAELESIIYGTPKVERTNVPPPPPPKVTTPAAPTGRGAGAGPAGSQRTPAVAPMEKTQTNARTGAKRVLISLDGGKTWKVKQ
jgi:Spy/CpxP family protein refolding chaperone